MLIEQNGVTPKLKFKNLAQGEAFYLVGSQGVLLMKGYNFQGIGECSINLANGAVITSIKKDDEVVRVNAKVVVE